MMGLSRGQRWALLIGSVVLVSLVLRYAGGYVLPFALGLALMSTAEPVVRWLQRHLRLSRPLAVLGGLVTVLGVVIVVLGAGIAVLVPELVKLSREMPRYYPQLLAAMEEASGWLGAVTRKLPLPLQSALEMQLERAYELVMQALGAVLSLLRGLPGFAAILMVGFLAAYFLGRDREEIIDYLRCRLSNYPWERIAQGVAGAVWGFVRATALLVTVSAVICTLGLVMIGARHALVLGLLAGLLDLLPVVGPGLLLLPWAAHALWSGQVGLGIGLGVLYGVMSLVRTSLEPRVMGTRVGLHPLTTLACIYCGVRFFGLWGFALGPLLGVAAKVLAQELVLEE